MDFNQAISLLVGFLAEHYVQIIIVAVGLYLLRNKYQKTLWKIPGPAIASFTDLWRLYHIGTGRIHLTHADLHRKYGPLVRIGPNVVSVGDPKAIPIIYGSTAGFQKSDFYPIFSITYQKKVLVNLFSVNDVDQHKKMKRPIANAYSMAAALEMEGGVDSCSQLFISRMDDYATSGESIDLGTWLQYYASDIMGEFTFNKKLGFLEKGGDVDGILSTLDFLLKYGIRCGQIPILHKFLLGNPLVPRLFPFLETYNSVLNFTLKALKSRGSFKSDNKTLALDEESMGKDQLSRWCAINAKDPDKLSTEDIVVHTAANVMGGSDTVSVAFRAIIYHLLRNPRILAKVVDDIDQANEAGQLSTPITYKEATTHFLYFQAVVKEAMRIHPSIGMIFERYVPAGGVEICGQHIAGGTIVGVNPWVVQHDPSVFPEPETFIPERWIDNSPDQLKQMEASIFLFGGGSRMCVGKSIAFLEIYKLVPEILRRYTVTLANPEKEWTVKNRWVGMQIGQEDEAGLIAAYPTIYPVYEGFTIFQAKRQ